MQQDGLTNSRQRLSGLLKEDERYSRLGLRGNPFFAGGLAPSNPQIEPWPEVRNKILDFLTSFLKTGSSNGLMLLGAYGTGKTYHLNYIRSILDDLSIQFKVRTVTITDPGIHPYNLIRGILLELGEEEVATMMWSVIGPHIRAHYERDQNYFQGFLRTTGRRGNNPSQPYMPLLAALEKLDEEAWSDHRLFFQAMDRNMILDRTKLLANVIPTLTTAASNNFITSSTEIAQNLAAVCLYDGVPALERWQGLTEGVGTGAVKPGSETQFLTALLNLLIKSGIEYCVILLDEFEKVPQLFRMTERDARSYLDTLRMLIDEAHRHLPFAYIVGSIEDAWRIAIDQMLPLKDRFEVVNLPRMIDNEIATYTIRSYLAQMRASNASNGSESSLAPFPEDLLEIIPADARQTTRQLVRLCYILIEQAAREEFDTVPESLVKRVVSGTSSERE